jgi:ATP synthase protein I
MTWRTMGGTGSTSSSRNGLSGGQPPASGQPPESGPVEDNQGWSIFSYLIAGMVAYGLIGWLVAWLTHIPVLLPLGALAGLVFAIGGVVWKYGRY